MNVFDRTYAHGPWRALPVPAHLADRRAGVTFQLGWTAVLVALFVLAGGIASRLVGGDLFPRATPGVVAEQTLPLVLMAIGMSVVFARGGFDFSAFAISSVAAIVAVKTGSPWLGLAAALACGLVNGLLVGLLRAPGWLVTTLTVPLFQHAGARIMAGPQFLRLEDPEAMGWALRAAPLVAVAAGVVAIVWAQVLPAGAPRRGAVRRLLAEAVLPYLFSAALAAMAGFAVSAIVQGAGPAPSESLELGLAVVLGGTFLGAGRANVLGAVATAFAIGALRFALLAHGAAAAGGIVLKTALLAAVCVSAAAHFLAARRHARAHGAGPELPVAGGGIDRPRLFDRGLFQGPGALVPVPVHLGVRRSALRFELGWTAVLLVLFAAYLVPAVGAPDAGWANPSFFGPQLVIPLLLSLGAAAVVARGGFDFSALTLMAVVTQLAAKENDPWLALGLALVVGVAHALLVGLVRIPGWILTFATAVLLDRERARLALLVRTYEYPEATMRWLPTATYCALGVAAVVALVWLQLAAGRPPAQRVAPWRARLADGLPYLYSSLLAGLAGLFLLALTTKFLRQHTVGEEAVIALILAGCWLGAGRANVLGILVGVVGFVLAQFAIRAELARIVDAKPHERLPTIVTAVLAGLALAALVASRVAHLLRGRAHARRASIQGGAGGSLASSG
ncbi:MAG TPA: hypothetical protein VEB43_05185 [Anaeromyxobacter sp.]|nr:hypothetical protein [Anaeromyxobacter sp.]